MRENDRKRDRLEERDREKDRKTVTLGERESHRGKKRKKDKGRRDRKKRMADSVDCGRERERATDRKIESVRER